MLFSNSTPIFAPACATTRPDRGLDRVASRRERESTPARRQRPAIDEAWRERNLPLAAARDPSTEIDDD
jgi:hypothetical protein